MTAQRWDVATLHDAHVDYRERVIQLVVVIGGGEHRMFDERGTSDKMQDVRARTINDFIADPSKHELAFDDEDGHGPNILFAFMALFGFAILAGTNMRYPARRVVLDEKAGTARFEERPWLKWKEDVTVPIGEGAAIEQQIASYEPERDDALDEVKAFFVR
jgi:hypothetical protein